MTAVCQGHDGVQLSLSNNTILNLQNKVRAESLTNNDISPSSVHDISNIESEYNINKIDDLNVIGDTMVYTNNGLYKICDLVGKEVEIWSGNRWFRVFIYIGITTHKIKKITMCNGLCLKCTDNQKWAIINKNKIIPVSTNDLEINMRIPTYQLPDLLLGDIAKNAYDIGKQIGKLFVLKLSSPIQLPEQIYTLCPQSLGRFIAGWMDSQNGNIYGNYNIIHDLQLLLARLHIYISHIVKKNTYYMLKIPDTTNIPNPNNKIRELNSYIKKNRLYISSIETIISTQKMYSIQNLDPKTKTIVLDGVLAII